MPENLEMDEKVTTFAHVNETSRDGAEVARWAHNPKVVGSNPAPATKRGSPFGGSLIFYMLGIGMCADSSVVAYLRVSRNLVGINFRHPNVMPNFAVWKTITYRHWHRWCCQPRF